MIYKTKRTPLDRVLKDSFARIRYISKETCRIFVFVSTNEVLVKKNDVVDLHFFLERCFYYIIFSPNRLMFCKNYDIINVLHKTEQTFRANGLSILYRGYYTLF